MKSHRLALAIGLMLILPSPAHAYRTAAQREEFSGADRVTWAPGRPVPFRVHRAGGPGVSLATAREAALSAFEAWSGVGCASVDFRYAGTSASRALPDDGFNDLYWVRESGLWTELGLPPDALAVTDVTYERPDDGEWRIAEADILLNGVSHHWSAMAGEATGEVRSLRAVLTHEAGHFIGLQHVCDVGDDPGAPACARVPEAQNHVMYPGYVGPEHFELSADDAAGACFLYDCAVAGCGGDEVCTADGCVVSCLGTACGPGETCGTDGCWSPLCPGPDCPASCGSDEACAAGQVCVLSRCVARGARDGDPCTRDRDCARGSCGAASFCVANCQTDASCPPDHRCVGDAPDGQCAPNAGVFGESCVEAADCSTRLCLQGTERSLCSRTCSEASPCPPGHTCSTLDGEQLCLPLSTGCSASPGGAVAPGALVYFFSLCLVLFRRQRRSKCS